MTKIITVLLLCLTSTVQAGIYQWKDPQGNTHYSDRPKRHAKRIDISPGYHFQRVSKVYDGDTIQLANGEKIRLAGINTPEIESRYRQEEPGGDQAKQWVTERLAGKKIRLETDLEKHDKYRRKIAHIFAENKEHINAILVAEGLAFVRMHPPNLKYSDLLFNKQVQARSANKGIWANNYYGPTPYTQFSDKAPKQWQRVTGRITRIKPTRKNIYLKFSDTFAIKIAKKHQHLFPELNRLLNKQIEVRGWIRRSYGKLHLQITHPGDISMIDTK